jgi:uncharacterized membrane protein
MVGLEFWTKNGTIVSRLTKRFLKKKRIKHLINEKGIYLKNTKIGFETVRI